MRQTSSGSPGTVVDPSGVRPALRLWIALARCYQTFAKAVGQQLGAEGLTTAQFGVLEALYHLGPLTLSELAGKLLVTGGNITYVMDRLESAGWVYRERCGKDRRVVWAKLTDDGERFVSEVFPRHADHVRDLTAVLDPVERDQLRSLLKKLGRGLAETP